SPKPSVRNPWTPASICWAARRGDSIAWKPETRLDVLPERQGKPRGLPRTAALNLSISWRLLKVESLTSSVPWKAISSPLRATSPGIGETSRGFPCGTAECPTRIPTFPCQVFRVLRPLHVELDRVFAVAVSSVVALE